MDNKLLIDNEISSKHTIVCIRDTFKEYSNRYLVYYDMRWDCLFFPNFATVENNKSNIIERISRQLKIDPKYLHFDMGTSVIQSKFSHSDKVNKFYDHIYYIGNIEQFTDETMKDDFIIDGIHYYWKTISELEKDKNVIEKNLDVIKVVKSRL